MTAPPPALPAPDEAAEAALRRVERHLDAGRPPPPGAGPPGGPYGATLAAITVELDALLEAEYRVALAHAGARPPRGLLCGRIVQSLGLDAAVEFCIAVADLGLLDGRNAACAPDRRRMLLARMGSLGWLGDEDRRAGPIG